MYNLKNMARSEIYLGVDVGGTKIHAGLVSQTKVIKQIRVATGVNQGRPAVINNIKKTISELNSSQVKGIGVSIAGSISADRGSVLFSPNLPKNFKNVPLGKILKKTFKKEIRIENDANCFTLGEAIFGAGKKYDNVVGLTLGTGVGSGWVMNSKIYSGAQHLATELGHTTIVDHGIECNCGQKGHLEIYASGSGMIKLYKLVAGKKADAYEIEKKAKRKDRQATQVFHIMQEALAVGLANIINGLNPGIVVLGGGLIRVPLFWRPAIALARKKLIYQPSKRIPIVKGKLGENAAVLGATLLFKQ